jgi:hypothetical protein
VQDRARRQGERYLAALAGHGLASHPAALLPGGEEGVALLAQELRGIAVAWRLLDEDHEASI